MMAIESEPGREWGPGDVVLLPDGTRAIIDGAGRFVYGWGDFEYAKPGSVNARRARPLVVIDPEDAEQVDTLTKALVEAAHLHGNFAVSDNGIHPDTTARALREFTNPTPRIEEPMGLGAVVEDDAGDLLVRFRDDEEAWHCSHTGTDFAWSDLNVVRVLSEGVS